MSHTHCDTHAYSPSKTLRKQLSEASELRTDVFDQHTSSTDVFDVHKVGMGGLGGVHKGVNVFFAQTDDATGGRKTRGTQGEELGEEGWVSFAFSGNASDGDADFG